MKKSLPNLVRDLPERITDKNLDQTSRNYTFKEFTEIKYPQDLDESSQLFRAVEVKLQEEFVIDAKIKFDYPFAMFDL